MKTITIRLEGIMQSYGESSDSPTANYKTTGDHPTKSAIIGMIASALGYRRDDERIESLNKLSYAVRIDQPGSQMVDYQNVRYREKARLKIHGHGTTICRKPYFWQPLAVRMTRQLKK